MKPFLQSLSISIFVLCLASCTENPLWEDEETGDVITGTVQLNGVDSPADVFIWLKEFDLTTRPGQDGTFSLPVPSIDSPISGQSVSGDYPIYFYVNNYTVDSVLVEFVNGKLVVPQPALDENYALKESIKLKKLLEVSLVAKAASTNTIEFRTKITPLVDNVVIHAAGRIDENELVEFTGFLLVDSNGQFVRLNGEPNHAVVRYMVRSPRAWFAPVMFEGMQFDGKDKDLQAIPYVVVLQSGIDHIRNRLGLEAEDYTSSYLKLPFAHSGGTLEQ